MNRIHTIAIALIATATLAGCSSDTTTSTPPTTPAPAPSATPTVVTPATTTPTPQITIGGKTYAITYYTCAEKIWNQRVAQWNTMTSDQRDRWPDPTAWMKSKGWPTTHEATLLAPATRKACPA